MSFQQTFPEQQWFGLRFDCSEHQDLLIEAEIDSVGRGINAIVTYPEHVNCMVYRKHYADDRTRLFVLFQIVAGLRIIFVESDHPQQSSIVGDYHSFTLLASDPRFESSFRFQSLGTEVITEDMTITRLHNVMPERWTDIEVHRQYHSYPSIYY